MPGGQAQTPNYLETVLLNPGQGAGTITPTRMQDIPASFVPWDDPANVSGLGAPAIVRATVSTYGLIQSGEIVVGAGQTTPVRTANATALQNALTYATSNTLFFEIVPGTYEIYSSTGLLIPQNSNCFVWRGATNSAIVQYYNGGTGAPVITLGNTLSASNFIGYMDFQGANFQYGIAQTGLTNSNAVVIGAVAWSRMCHVYIGAQGSPTPPFPAYQGMLLTAGEASFFSNRMDGIYINGAQFNILNISGSSTGSVWDNVYLGGGGGSENYPTLSGSFFYSETGTNENNFEQINCEWAACNVAITVQNLYGTYFRHLHLEGWKATGANPIAISSSDNAITVDMMSMVDCVYNTANMSGTGYILAEYFPSQSCNKINKLVITTSASGEVNTAVQLYGPYSGPPSDTVSTFQLDDLKINDSGGGNWFTGHLSLDGNMTNTGAAFLTPYLALHYEYGIAGSLLIGACINVSSTYTHYGQLEKANLFVPASITSFTITLADTMGATGTQVPRVGNWVTIRRQTGTASGTLTIKDGGGTTLATNTTSNANLSYQFTGTAWASFTIV